MPTADTSAPMPTPRHHANTSAPCQHLGTMPIAQNARLRPWSRFRRPHISDNLDGCREGWRSTKSLFRFGGREYSPTQRAQSEWERAEARPHGTGQPASAEHRRADMCADMCVYACRAMPAVLLPLSASGCRRREDEVPKTRNMSHSNTLGETTY